MPNSMVKPDPGVRPAVQSALDAFDELQRRLMSVHAPDFAALDITMAQAKLLYVVTASRELTMSDIAQRLGVTVSTASGSVDHLVDLGLLRRVDDPSNRRQVRVSVTPLGLQRLEQLRELGTSQLRALYDAMTDAELKVIVRAARIMARAVDASTLTAAPSRSPE
jgi:DNA-binding MarR family transcriptional regulator